MLDTYDMFHTNNIKDHIDIYSNYDKEYIDKIIDDYIDKDLEKFDEKWESVTYKRVRLRKEIEDVITLLKKSLDVLEKRNITSISGRIINNKYTYYDRGNTSEYWTIIRVFRCRV